MGTALIRQWWILTLLPRPPQKIDTATLLAKLRERGVVTHRRTVQRDLIELAVVFPIVADERSKPYGWRWAEDTRPTMPVQFCPQCGMRLPV